ncbi:MAG: HDOD domain-containing protein [Gemmatimonadaceae bacterium]|nr:HDOD domain-containing protein [Gemmatimonadaceae bacterium]
MMQQVIRITLDRVATVATLPDVAMRVMKIADDPQATEDDLHDVLISDPALAARVLRVVNSAFYRRQREVSSPRGAIKLLGLNAIRNVALAASLHRLFRGRRAIVGFDPTEVWSHSVAVGTAARELAHHVSGLAPEEAMVAGLLHDIGLILELQAWAPEFAEVVKRAALIPTESFAALERELIGATHEDLGGALCDHWDFPSEFVNACRHHHDFRAAPEEARRMPAVVHLADRMAARLGAGFTRTVDGHGFEAEACLLLGISSDVVRDVEEQLPILLPQTVALLAA